MFVYLIGLIEGASDNKGLGHEFLRHIERTKVLIYVVDMSNTSNKAVTSSSDAIEDFITLRRELELYNPLLLDKPSFVFANKLDITRKDWF